LALQLLAKDPAARPATAAEVAERLQALERQLAAPPAPPPAPEMLPPSAPGPDGSAGLRPWALVTALVLLALLSLGYFFGGTVARFATNKGVLVVQVDDANVEVAIKQNGVIVRDRTTKREFVLTAGDGEVE